MADKIDSDYVHMGETGVKPGTGVAAGISNLGLDDPNLSQEELDLRLAISLQQQENARVLANAKKKKTASNQSNLFRTGRSGVNSRLAAVRDKDHGALSYPDTSEANAYNAATGYAPPGTGGAQEDSDMKLARELQRVEATSISASVQTEKLQKLEAEELEARKHRTLRSGKPAFHKVSLERFSR